MKKSIKIVLTCTVLLFLTLVPVAYSADINGCTIIATGTYPALENANLNRSGNVVFLTHPTAWTGSRTFFLSQDLGNSGLATLLTAFSLGKPVFVRIGESAATPAVPWGIITVIYVNS